MRDASDYTYFFQVTYDWPTHDKLAKDLALFDTYLRDNCIYNAEYKDLKFTLTHVVFDAFEKLINEKYKSAGKHESLPGEIKYLLEKTYRMPLSHVKTLQSKLSTLTIQHPAIDDVSRFVDEALPIALGFDHLKNHIVKGRRPRENPKSSSDNPNKLNGTCPCCFQIVAVRSTMVHHGFRRPGTGSQTLSCFAARRFPPLEVSKDGLEWLITLERDAVTTSERHLANRDQWERIFILGSIPAREIKKGDPDWPEAERLEFERRTIKLREEKRLLARHEQIAANWTPRPWPDEAQRFYFDTDRETVSDVDHLVETVSSFQCR